MKLTFVQWYTSTAAYRDGDLFYCGCGSLWSPLLLPLGYETRTINLPLELPDEFDKDHRGGWQPPSSLSRLEGQLKAYNGRLAREAVEEAELALVRAREELRAHDEG